MLEISWTYWIWTPLIYSSLRLRVSMLTQTARFNPRCLCCAGGDGGTCTDCAGEVDGYAYLDECQKCVRSAAEECFIETDCWGVLLRWHLTKREVKNKNAV